MLILINTLGAYWLGEGRERRTEGEYFYFWLSTVRLCPQLHRRQMQRMRRLFCTAERPKCWLELCGLILAFLVILPVAAGQPDGDSARPAHLDNLDGLAPVLQPRTLNSRFTVDRQTIDRESFLHGNGAERILLRGPAGQAVELAYPLTPAPIIREFRIRVDLATNRAGIRLAARVVLPRSLNRRTGRPFELLVRSDKIGSGGGIWEELTLENLPALLARSARVARAQSGLALDERGAYVSQIVFLAPGGPGSTDLIIDRIQVFGLVGQPSRPPGSADNISTTPRISATINKTANPRKKSPRVPRIIQWQGEPFELLKQLGFNTVGMERLPTAEELNQLEQLGLALFCPPPTPIQLNDKGITSDLDLVLAWNLGEQLSSADLTHVESWERLVARHDPIDTRPTVLTSQLETLAASRIADCLLVGRPVIGTDLTIRQHTAWLAQRQRLARPGTPLWNQIETQPSPRQQLQRTALSDNSAIDQGTTYAQLSALTSASLNIKTRGFYFQSQAQLSAERSANGQDVAMRPRELALELTNLRLQLIEPWIAAGRELSAARSTRPDLSALVMQAERSHLLVPIWWSLDLKSRIQTQTTEPVSFIVPGVAETSEAFLVTLGGLQRVRHKRVTGGVRISLEELPFDSVLMLSDDPQAISQVTRYVRRISERAAKIRRDLAEIRLQEVARSHTRVKKFTTKTGPFQTIFAQAQQELATCDQYLKSGTFDLAYLRANAADLAINDIEKELQAEFVSTNTPSTTSLTNHAAMALPDRLQLQKMLARAPAGANLLTGGGFENLAAMLHSGWRHQKLPLEDITSSVRLSPEAPHSGSYCLELEARSLDESAPTSIVPTPPVWITTSPLPVHAGDLLEITGVVRLPEPLVGSVDGLQIIDSIGGPDMALRIHEAPSWQHFRLIRAATNDTQVSVTIALSGLGKAQIDDVAVRVVKRR